MASLVSASVMLLEVSELLSRGKGFIQSVISCKTTFLGTQGEFGFLSLKRPIAGSLGSTKKNMLLTEAIGIESQSNEFPKLGGIN